jgi:hypothetical protein
MHWSIPRPSAESLGPRHADNRELESAEPKAHGPRQDGRIAEMTLALTPLLVQPVDLRQSREWIEQVRRVLRRALGQPEVRFHDPRQEAVLRRRLEELQGRAALLLDPDHGDIAGQLAGAEWLRGELISCLVIISRI